MLSEDFLMAKRTAENNRMRPRGPADQEEREPLPGVQPEPASPPRKLPEATEITDEASGPKSEAELERDALAARHRPDERSPLAPAGPPGSGAGGIHAAGEPGGGSAIGGLAGSNEGDGTPDLERLEEAGGSGNFDQRLAEEDEEAYSGHAGGAVGGTPAGKRARGGRTHGGIAPEEETHRGDSTVGSDPHFHKDSPQESKKKPR